MNLALFLILLGMMHVVRSFTTGGEPGGAGTSLAFGFMLVSGYFAGTLAKEVHLPKLTGYMLMGALAGPAALDLVSVPMVESLKLVNGVAVAMIALTAGNELEIGELKPLLRTVLTITFVGVLGTAGLLALTVYLARPMLPFMSGMQLVEAATVAGLIGVVMVAPSPAVVVALRDELWAVGPVSRTALAVVVLANLVVILLFAIFSTLTKAVFGSSTVISATLATLAWEVLGSLAAGTVVGGVLAVYFRKVETGGALFLLAVAFVIAEVGGRLSFDPTLLALAAGATVRNVSDAADKLRDQLQISAMPVYVLFFCVAGATVHLDALAVVWRPALLIVAVRATGLLAGATVGARMARAPFLVTRYVGFGLLPQAGLALALSMLFSRMFPEFGAEAAALTLSVVAINELLAPAAYRVALERSGEAGKDQSRSRDTSISIEIPIVTRDPPQPG
jgi:Kef-type K+ transport system membrane component KefB